MKPRIVERIEVFPTGLPVVKTFEFDGAVHVGTEAGIGVAPDPGALGELCDG